VDQRIDVRQAVLADPLHLQYSPVVCLASLFDQPTGHPPLEYQAIVESINDFNRTLNSQFLPSKTLFLHWGKNSNLVHKDSQDLPKNRRIPRFGDDLVEKIDGTIVEIVKHMPSEVHEIADIFNIMHF
jgi:hypothetical protein